MSPKKPRRTARPPYVDVTGPSDAVGDTAAPVDRPAAAAKRPTKQNLVLDLLCQGGGTSLAAITEATGWLPHTARAALTGLRKKGHDIARCKIDGETRYAITASAAQ